MAAGFFESVRLQNITDSSYSGSPQCYTRFHENRFRTFRLGLILFTEIQTDRQTNSHRPVVISTLGLPPRRANDPINYRPALKI